MALVEVGVVEEEVELSCSTGVRQRSWSINLSTCANTTLMKYKQTQKERKLVTLKDPQIILEGIFIGGQREKQRELEKARP